MPSVNKSQRPLLSSGGTKTSNAVRGRPEEAARPPMLDEAGRPPMLNEAVQDEAARPPMLDEAVQDEAANAG